MDIKNRRNGSRLNGCSPLQLMCILIGDYHVIGYYFNTKCWGHFLMVNIYFLCAIQKHGIFIGYQPT